jgi:hypothetical protein
MLSNPLVALILHYLPAQDQMNLALMAAGRAFPATKDIAVSDLTEIVAENVFHLSNQTNMSRGKRKQDYWAECLTDQIKKAPTDYLTNLRFAAFFSQLRNAPTITPSKIAEVILQSNLEQMNIDESMEAISELVPFWTKEECAKIALKYKTEFNWRDYVDSSLEPCFQAMQTLLNKLTKEEKEAQAKLLIHGLKNRSSQNRKRTPLFVLIKEALFLTEDQNLLKQIWDELNTLYGQAKKSPVGIANDNTPLSEISKAMGVLLTRLDDNLCLEQFLNMIPSSEAPGHWFSVPWLPVIRVANKNLSNKLTPLQVESLIVRLETISRTESYKRKREIYPLTLFYSIAGLSECLSEPQINRVFKVIQEQGINKTNIPKGRVLEALALMAGKLNQDQIKIAADELKTVLEGFSQARDRVMTVSMVDNNVGYCELVSSPAFREKCSDTQFNEIFNLNLQCCRLGFFPEGRIDHITEFSKRCDLAQLNTIYEILSARFCQPGWEYKKDVVLEAMAALGNRLGNTEPEKVLFGKIINKMTEVSAAIRHITLLISKCDEHQVNKVFEMVMKYLDNRQPNFVRCGLDELYPWFDETQRKSLWEKVGTLSGSLKFALPADEASLKTLEAKDPIRAAIIGFMLENQKAADNPTLLPETRKRTAEMLY